VKRSFLIPYIQDIHIFVVVTKQIRIVVVCTIYHFIPLHNRRGDKKERGEKTEEKYKRKRCSGEIQSSFLRGFNKIVMR